MAPNSNGHDSNSSLFPPSILHVSEPKMQHPKTNQLFNKKYLTSFFIFFNVIHFSEHPQIETITPVGLAKKYFDGIRYDLVVTFSSIEHSGLGR
jgi:hypothetical protein